MQIFNSKIYIINMIKIDNFYHIELHQKKMIFKMIKMIKIKRENE